MQAAHRGQRPQFGQSPPGQGHAAPLAGFSDQQQQAFAGEIDFAPGETEQLLFACPRRQCQHHHGQQAAIRTLRTDVQKALAFGIAAFYAGIAGSLWAHYSRLITPEHFSIVTSIDYVAMVVMGGLTSVWGPHLGAALVILLSQGLKIITPEVIAVLPVFAKIATPLREIVFGSILIALLIWEPGGIAVLLKKLKRKLDLWPFAY